MRSPPPCTLNGAHAQLHRTDFINARAMSLAAPQRVGNRTFKFDINVSGDARSAVDTVST
jgi:hypothetical protein